MATHTSSVSRSAALLSVAVAGAMTACTPKPNGPEPTAQAFFAALGRGDTGAAAELADKPNEARTAINQAWSGLQATKLDAQVLETRTPARSPTGTWHLPKVQSDGR